MTTEVDPASTYDRVPAPAPSAAARRARELVLGAICDDPRVVAAWEGGSASFGRADEASDLDVVVLVEDGDEACTGVFDSIDRALRAAVGELVAWTVPDPVAGSHRFWRPGDGDGVSLVDVSAIPVGEAGAWRALLVPEQHGRALVLHDPAGVLERAIGDSVLDLDEHRARLASELEQIRSWRTLYADFVDKELDRGRVLDAAAFHRRLFVTPLVSLLGMRYRPLRFGFGLRYVHEEFPTQVIARLEPIVAADDLGTAVAEARRWIDELLDELDPATVPLEAHAASMRAVYGASTTPSEQRPSSSDAPSAVRTSTRQT